MKTSTVTALFVLSALSLLLASCSGETVSIEKISTRKIKQSKTVESSKHSSDKSSEVSKDDFEQPRLTVAQAMKKYGRRGENDYVLAAERAEEIDDNDAALLLLTKALSLNNKNGQAYYERGCLRYNVVAGADDAAMEDLKRAIALGAGGADAYRFLARIYDSKKQPEKAIEMLDKAIELYPDDHDSYKYRATICLACGRKDKARKDYDKMLEVEPGDSQVYFRRAELLAKERKKAGSGSV